MTGISTTGRVTDGGQAFESDREQASRALAHAAAAGGMTLGEYAARATAIQRAAGSDELNSLVQSLPEEPAAASSHRMPRWVLAVLGGSAQRGRWRLGRRMVALAVLGGATLDLTAAEAAVPEASINAIAVLGGIEIIAPPGVAVELSGIALVGGKADKRSPGSPLPGSPVVRVHAFTFLGGVAIKEPDETQTAAAV